MVLRDIIRCEPAVLKALLCGNPTSRVLLQHLSDQILGGIRDLVPVCGVKSKWLLQHIAENLLVVIALERRVAAQEYEEDDTEGPDIAGLVVVALEHLGCNVVWGADNSVHSLDGLLLGETFGKTEINKFDFRLFRSVVHQEVLRFEISVDDSVTMQVLDSGEHFAHDVGGLVLAEPLRGHDAIEELTALAVLHDDVDVAMIDVALVELDDVGVVDCL